MADRLPDILLLNPLPPASVARLAESTTVHDGTTEAARAAAVAAAGDRIRAVLTIGTIGCSAELIAALPALEIVSCMGVGYEGIDVAAARGRGIVLTHGRGTNAATVADHALALMLAVIREVAAGDRAVRRGEWRKPSDQPATLFGRPVGIVGLGDVGLGVGARCAGGFAAEVSYCNRRPRSDVPYRFVASVLDLAASSDVLVLCAPGGPETRHLVDAAVLEALGPDGFLVNVARGGIVDTAALVSALRERRIAGAALDVVEGEPAVPPDLLGLANLVITPHLGGASPASREAMLSLAIANFRAFFAGEPVSMPIP